MRSLVGIGSLVITLLLFVILFNRKKKNSLYDNFFDDAEIIKDFEEAPIPSAVPAPLMDAQQDSGNKETECEQGGYMAFTFPNPTPNPITVNIISPSQYYQSIQAYYDSQASSTTNYSVGGNLSATQQANGLYYGMDRNLSTVRIFNPTTGVSVSNVSLAPNQLNIVGGGHGEEAIIVNNLLIIPGFRYVSVIDVNPISGTYNQLMASVDCGAGSRLNNCAVFGSFVYVSYHNGSLSGFRKISLSSLTLITTNQVVSTCTANPTFPNYKLGQTSSQYLYIMDNVNAICNVWDTSTDTLVTASVISNATTGQPCIAVNEIYIPQASNIDVFNTGSNSVTDTITTSITCTFALFNGSDTVYLSGSSTGITPIQVSTNTLLPIVTTGFISNVTIISNNLLYASDSQLLSTSDIALIDTNENSSTYDTVTATITNTLASLNNPIIISGPPVSVLFTSFNQASVTNTVVGVSTSALTDQIVVNLNNMENMQANPGMICGIFYRSLTVAQMSNVFSLDYNNALGETNTYKLIPITYKDTMSMLNQIYVSKFFQPIIINNNLNLYHVINPGENVYIKIYVKNYISNVEMLKTGEIGISKTEDSSVFKGGDTEEENDQDEEGWMTIDEVEAGEWDVIHIQCDGETTEDETEEQAV